MRGSSRCIIKGLTAEHFKCDLVSVEQLCDDCGVILKHGIAHQIISGKVFCKECAPWYREQQVLDEILVQQDLLRDMGVNPPRRAVEELEAELDFGERDYWD